MIRQRLAIKDPQGFDEVTRLNWAAADAALSDLDRVDRTCVEALYLSSKPSLAKSITMRSAKTGVSERLLWALVRKVEGKAAKVRKLTA